MSTIDMIIVCGTVDLDPIKRDAFIAERLDAVRGTRLERGCLACAYSADPVDLGRVLLFEKWATEELFDAHVAATCSRASRPKSVLGNVVSVSVHRVASERWLGGWDQDETLVGALRAGAALSAAQRHCSPSAR